MRAAEPRSLRLADRLYSLVLRRHSAADAATAAEMRRTFRELCRREWEARGSRGVWRRTAEELLDVARTAPAKPGRARRGQRGRGGGFGQTLVHALRSVRRRPAYAAAFILTMAVGIGVNAAMFAVVSAVALRPLPYRDADRLAQLWSLNAATQRDGPTVPPAEFLAWREHTDLFETFEGFGPEAAAALSGSAEPRQVMVARVTTGLFAMLGATPVLGRSFGVDEGLPGGPRVVVIGHGLWTSAFGSDPGIIGRTVRLRDEDHTVIGVMPPRFAFPYGAAEAWLPVSATPTGLEASGALTGLAHLRPELTREAAEERLSERLRTAAQGAEPVWLPMVRDLGFMRTAETTRRTLVLLFGAVLFVLLIATANVLSLGVAEAARRQRELAVMATLGAGRARILGQLVGEAAILSFAGAAVGLVLAGLALAGLVPLIPERLNLQTGGRAMALWPDGVGLAITAALLAAPLVGSLTALLARVGGTAPLARAAAGADRAGRRIQHALVAAQVALSLVLLAGAGLLVDSFGRLVRVDPVVAADELLLVRLQLPQHRYPEAAHRAAAVEAMREALQTLPGVLGVAPTSSPLPLARARFRPELEADGGTPLSLDDFLPYHEVGEGFFETLGIRIVRGRALVAADAGQPVAVVNEVLARRLWPDASDPLHRRFRVRADDPWLTVVGVSEDVPQMGLRDPWGEGMEFYLPAGEQAGTRWTFALRTGGDPAALVEGVRQAIWAVDDRQPIEALTTWRAALGEDMGRERFYTILLAGFALLATLLAAVGIHAVVAQVVLNRTREIGIRVALGAGRLRIARSATASGAGAVTVGVVLGLAATFALTRFLESLLFGVEPRDARVLALNILVILVVAAAAVLVPVRRALAVEPVDAMRTE